MPATKAEEITAVNGFARKDGVRDAAPGSFGVVGFPPRGRDELVEWPPDCARPAGNQAHFHDSP